MKLPAVKGLIQRRILVNFRMKPEVIQPQLPANFRPKLHAGSAIAGICLIRLEQVRIRGLPAFTGLSSENAAHRIAVIWTDENGTEHEGVYVPRRDTDSLLNQLAGGRVFAGEHHPAAFQVREDDERVDIQVRSKDGQVAIQVRGRTAAELPPGSVFMNTRAASDFFENGSLGYSATTKGRHLEGVRLKVANWSVQPMAVEHVHSSFFADARRFSPGAVEFDCALLMRNIEHEWLTEPDLYL